MPPSKTVEICFVYWSNWDGIPGYTIHDYWVHDNEVCRLRGVLEGHHLFRHENGDNPTGMCLACRKHFYEKVVDETERS